MKANVKNLFDPIRIGTQTIKNRIAMPAMDTNYAEKDGTLSKRHVNYLKNRARGGAGLIILEATSVSWPEGKISERQVAMNDDTQTPSLHYLTDSVHSYGAKILVQIHHGGFMAVPEYCGGAQSVSATDFNGAKALTVEEIHKIVNDFIHAAQVAQKGGFDGVEIHAAHMYLLNQFINPSCNTRTDEYGGNHEKRFRIIREIIQGIREACGSDFIIDVRLGAYDYVSNGNTLDDGCIYAKFCEEAGADMLNITAGFYSVMETEQTQWDPEGKFLFMSEAIKKAVKIPVAIVGKMRTPAFCAQAIDEGKADIIMIGRQLICDPSYPNKIMMGREDEIRPCLNCLEGCLGSFYFDHSSIHCVINPYAGYEDVYSEFEIAKSGRPSKILVVGGGIAGMQFAIIAKRRGHNVTIAEKSSVLGGEMILAASTPFKEDVGKALEWYKAEVNRVDVPVMLNTMVDKEFVHKFAPEKVVLATGFRFVAPSIEGIEHAYNGEDVLSGAVDVGTEKKICIIGGGVVGCELAHKLIENGNKVTVLEMLPEICVGLEFAHRTVLTDYMNRNAKVEVSATVTKVTPKSLEFTDKDGRKQSIPADYTVYCAGQAPQSPPLYTALLSDGFETYRIADYERMSNFLMATRQAMDLAYTI